MSATGGYNYEPPADYVPGAYCKPPRFTTFGSPELDRFARNLASDPFNTMASLGMFGGMGGIGANLESRVAGASNKALHELLKNELRAAMCKPSVANAELQGLIDKPYRGGAKVGSGSTAAAVRQELTTGAPVGDNFHSLKAADMMKALDRWLSNNPAASPGDRAAAENVIIELSNALQGR
jgi:hypothetical protein